MRRSAWTATAATLVFVLAAGAADPPDPADLVRRSLKAEEENRARASSYLYTEDITRRLVEGERVVESGSQRYEVIFLAREPYFRLVGRNGGPLLPEEEEEERRRLDAVAADRQAGVHQFSSPAERPRVSIVYRILPEFHEIRLLGSEKVAGRETWVLEAVPRRKSNSGGLNDKETRQMRVKIWLDQETLLRVRQDAEVVKKVGRLDKGAWLSYRFDAQSDGVWLVRQIIYRTPLEASKGVPRYREVDQVYSNYHKFQAESSLVPATGK